MMLELILSILLFAILFQLGVLIAPILIYSVYRKTVKELERNSGFENLQNDPLSNIFIALDCGGFKLSDIGIIIASTIWFFLALFNIFVNM